MTGQQGQQRGLKKRLGGWVAAARRRPLVDHVVRVVQRYGEAKGNLQAGGMTYFGFLSFFPILLLAFTLVGWISRFYPRYRTDLVSLVEGIFPGIIGGGEGQMQLTVIENAATYTGPIALAGLLYAGLGWVSALRQALAMVFDTADREGPNVILLKLRDLAVLTAVGTTLLASVAISGLLGWGARQLLELVGLGTELAPLVVALSLVLGIAASTLFFFLIFKLLARPPLSSRSLAKGALVGALGFEVLKRVSGVLIAATEGRPASQAFGIALILLVWINYFSRVVVLAACWAWTTRRAREAREQQRLTTRWMEDLARVELREAPHVPVTTPDRSLLAGAFAAGGATMLGLVAAVRRRGDG